MALDPVGRFGDYINMIKQHLATVLQDKDENGAKADAVHVEWLTHPVLSGWSWSDQIILGEIIGSKYYPVVSQGFCGWKKPICNFPAYAKAFPSSSR